MNSHGIIYINIFSINAKFKKCENMKLKKLIACNPKLFSLETWTININWKTTVFVNVVRKKKIKDKN